MGYPGAKQLAARRLEFGAAGMLTPDEQRILAGGYQTLERKIERLKKDLAGCSKRVSAAYDRGVEDERSRHTGYGGQPIRPGFGDMGG